jgi:hypothetical protein
VSPPSGCLVSKVSCPGERYQWLNSSVTCFVRQLDCPAALVSFAVPETCVVASLSCSGSSTVNNTVVQLAADPCVVSSHNCATGESCVDWVRLCDNSTECLWKKASCSNGCVVANSKNVCVCPVDYAPPACTPRPVRCLFALRSPTPSCEYVNPSDESAVDFDPVCHRFRTSDAVTFGYRMNCSLAASVNVTSGGNFSYAIFNQSANWALSSSRANNWTAQLKVRCVV